MKIYTKTGDKGKTSLFTGKRVPKHHIRIERYGTWCELSAHLGLLREQFKDAPPREPGEVHQKKLFTVGSILATEPTVNSFSWIRANISREGASLSWKN